MIPREEDTTGSMYPRPDGSPTQNQPLSTGRKKVDTVCDSLRSTMQAMSVNKSVTQRRLWENFFQIQWNFLSGLFLHLLLLLFNIAVNIASLAIEDRAKEHENKFNI